MSYVDGYVLAVHKDRIEDYKKVAATSGRMWKEHGALGYVECIGDDVPYGELTSFPRAVQAQEDEVIVFAYVTYNSRQHRDTVLAKVMADEQFKRLMQDVPVDGKRMIFGGFQSFVEL